MKKPTSRLFLCSVLLFFLGSCTTTHGFLFLLKERFFPILLKDLDREFKKLKDEFDGKLTTSQATINEQHEKLLQQACALVIAVKDLDEQTKQELRNLLTQLEENKKIREQCSAENEKNKQAGESIQVKFDDFFKRNKQIYDERIERQNQITQALKILEDSAGELRTQATEIKRELSQAKDILDYAQEKNKQNTEKLDEHDQSLKEILLQLKEHNAQLQRNRDLQSTNNNYGAPVD